MNEIRRVLRLAAWRLFAIDLLRRLALTLSAAVVALILIRIAERLFIFPVDWPTLMAGAAGAAALAALAWSLIARRRALAVARELDERADLRESLSTALCVASNPDAWSRAVVETARQRAAAVQVRRAIPIEPPRFWPVPLALVLSLVVIWYALPPLDLRGILAERRQAEAQQRELMQVKAEVHEAQKKIEELLAQAKVEPEELATPDAGTERPQVQTPEEIRRAAIKKLTSVHDQLMQARNGEKSERLEALKRMMRQLKQPGPGPLDELARAMSKGDFKAAKEKLDELAAKLADGSLSPEDQGRLKEQLSKLSEQLQKLAESREALEKKLQEAGLSPEQARQAAADPEALKRALEPMQNLSDEQKQKLMEMAKAQAEAAQQGQGMSQALGQMAKGLSGQGMSQQGMEGMDAMRGMLSESEMLSAEMAAMDAAMSECMAQLARMGAACEGGGQGLGRFGEMRISPWRAGESTAQGPGSGGPGKGHGVSPEAKQTAVNIDKQTSPTKLGPGPTIGSRLVHGDSVKGESVKEFAQAVEAGRQAAAEALDSMLIQREYHDAVKHYFGRLEARTRATTPAEPAAPAPSSEPAPK